MLYHWQGIEFEKYVKEFNPDFKNPFKDTYTKEWLDSLEESRKKW
jgi:hypothetical protein